MGVAVRESKSGNGSQVIGMNSGNKGFSSIFMPDFLRKFHPNRTITGKVTVWGGFSQSSGEGW